MMDAGCLEFATSTYLLFTAVAQLSHSLDSCKGCYIKNHVRDYFRGY